MYAVGRLGSYITRGVNTVSGPFHPFGGAVDIVVVEQQDGSFKSSPWYVRFGKFQGVLKAKEKVVNISVDGVEANLHMYLDNKGVAYFLREVDAEEVDSILLPSSSGEESDGRSGDRKPVKSKSCNYDVDHSNSVNQIDVISGKVVARTSSSRSRITGFVLGRKSMKEDRVLVEDGGSVGRVDYLERAEIAADLLELKWSTNISPNRHPKGISDGEAHKNSKINDGESEVEMSCLSIGIPNLGESGFEGNTELNSDMLREINKIGGTNADHDENAKILQSDIACPDSQSQDSGVSKEENELDRFQPFIHLDTSDSSKIGSDVFSQQANETPHLCCGNCEEVCAHAETLHETTELISEVNSQPETGMLVAKGTSNVHEFLGEKNCCNNSFSDPKILESERIFANANSIVTEAYAGSVNVLPVNGSAKEVESYSIINISSFSNSNCVVKDEKNTGEEDEMNMLQPSLEHGCDSREITGDFVMSEAINISPPEDPEEEQFLFSDLDDFKLGEVKPMESFSLDHVEKGNCSSLPSKDMEAVNKSSSSKFESDSSPDFIRENLPNDVEELRQTSKIISSHINIPRKNEVTAQEVGHMVESLPIMLSHSDELDARHLHHFVSHSLDSNSKSSKWMLIRKDVLSCKKSYGVEEHPSSNSQPTVEDAQISEELNNVPDRPAVGDPSKIIDSSNGTWRLWPFKGSRNTKVVEPALIYSRDFNAENALESTSGVDVEKDVPNPKANKKKIRAITPTSEQLASLNLKEGRNTVTFTFSTSVLGKQQVDAIIYLWRWDTRIVISDVDGTITKSDLLGQFMPMVGKDWSQIGVAHFFSAIKENGYQMLFLSARSISQAYHTRQFLFNLKQDGMSLPDGPVVISPDGLFPSLFREVIRRAPHEFKIGCLEDIRALFPSDRNPFYAGFGNRDTDEFSYLKVGIPKGKIFIINPKGEVVVNRRVDSKSYTELQALVNSMFPPIPSEQEDFNTWNYWKLPLPSIDM